MATKKKTAVKKKSKEQEILDIKENIKNLNKQKKILKDNIEEAEYEMGYWESRMYSFESSLEDTESSIKDLKLKLKSLQ